MHSLDFATLKGLSARYIDFLVLIPTHMDANRNESHYAHPGNTTVETFLGDKDWRSRRAKELGQKSFGQFIADSFTASMMSLGYKKPSSFEPVLIRRSDNNSPLYQLILYSRSQKGQEFWKKAQSYSTPQMELGLAE